VAAVVVVGEVDVEVVMAEMLVVVVMVVVWWWSYRLWWLWWWWCWSRNLVTCTESTGGGTW
jgi:hypothetical protein